MGLGTTLPASKDMQHFYYCENLTEIAGYLMTSFPVHQLGYMGRYNTVGMLWKTGKYLIWSCVPQDPGGNKKAVTS